MIPHGIDRKRFEFLLVRGISLDELREFFTVQKNSLMMAGERVQNLPSDLRAAVKRFCPAAHAVFRNWLSKQAHDSVIEAGQIVPRYRAAEELGVGFSTAEEGALASLTLRILYSDAPPEELLTFLRTPIPVHADVSEPTGIDLRAEEWLNFAASCRAREVPANVTNPVLRPAAQLVTAIAHRDRSLLAGVDDAVVEAFDREIERLSSLDRADRHPPDRGGLYRREVQVRPYDPETDYTAFEVIATRYSGRNDERTPWFATVEGFVDGKDVFTLERKDISRAIPTAGEVVIHRDRGFPVPAVGEARLYEVEMMQNDYRAKVRVTASLTRLIPMVSVPHASSEAQSIRRFITEFASKSSLENALFVTTDDLCLRTQEVSLGAVGTPNHEWQLDCWSRLDGYELATGTYVLEPLPPPTTNLDCAPLARVARRLLKAAADRSSVPLTKSQRDALVEVLGDEDFHASALTRKRLAENLASIDNSSEDYAQLIGALMQVPQIKKDVEDRTSLAVNQRLSEKASETKKIDNLKRERLSLEAAIKKLDGERDQKSRALKLAIRKAFTAATKRELEVLGDASLLAALISGASTSDIDPRPGPTPLMSMPVGVSVNSCSSEPLPSALAAFGLTAIAAETIADALSLAVRCGVAIVVQGTGSSELGRVLSAAISKTAFRSVDVGLGLIERTLPSEWLAPSECDVLLLQCANLSDVAVYAPKLIAVVVQRALLGKGSSWQPALVLTAASGPAALPWPIEVATLALKIDVDRVDQLVLDAGEPAIPVHPLQRNLLTKIERVAANEDCSKATMRVIARMLVFEQPMPPSS